MRATGRISLTTDLKPSDTVDLTYRRVCEGVTDDWLEQRVREVLRYDGPLTAVIQRVAQLPPGVASSAGELILSRRGQVSSDVFVVDRYLLPWSARSRRRYPRAHLDCAAQ